MAAHRRTGRRTPRHARPTDTVWWGSRIMAAICLAAAGAFAVGVLGELVIRR